MRIFCTYIELDRSEVVKDYALAIIKPGSKGGVFKYKTKMHKMLFILAQEFKKFDWLRNDFVPDHFGPWSYEVESTIIDNAPRLSGGENGYGRDRRFEARVYTCRLTRAGRALAEDAVEKLSPEINKKTRELLRVSIWELIGYVYVRYPEYATRSVYANDEETPREPRHLAIGRSTTLRRRHRLRQAVGSDIRSGGRQRNRLRLTPILIILKALVVVGKFI